MFYSQGNNRIAKPGAIEREELKKQIDNEFDKFYNKFEEYKTRCKTHLSTNEYKIEAEKISDEVRSAREKLNEWVAVLNEVKISNQYISKDPVWIRIKDDNDNLIDSWRLKWDSLSKMSFFCENSTNQKFKWPHYKKLT